MERLTQQNSTYYEKAIKQLQEYENTGLTPAEIEQLQKENAELKARLEKSVELPCRVGDKVYRKSRFSDTIVEAIVTDIIINRFGITYKAKIQISEFHFNDNELCKTVFLTKEEAEQALKGGADNEWI